MKHKFSAGILTACVLLSAAGCSSYTEITEAPQETKETEALTIHVREAEDTRVGTDTDTETDVGGVGAAGTGADESYAGLIAAVGECIQRKDGVIPEGYDFSRVLITAGDYEIPGYLIEDIDGNGTEELIFGANGTDPDITWDSVVYDIYTISDGGLVHVLNGWERNRYYPCENGMIANEGSSGAASSSYSYYSFEGSELHLTESVIFDGMRDSEHPWFHSTESEYDTEHAEPISEETADEIMGKYTYRKLDFMHWQ